MGKRRKMERRRGPAPQTVKHEGKTYQRDAGGNYRDDSGDILPVIVLMSILSGGESENAEASTPQDDFRGHGGDFGGAGASGDYSSSSDSSDSGGGSDGGGGGGGD